MRRNKKISPQSTTDDLSGVYKKKIKGGGRFFISSSKLKRLSTTIFRILWAKTKFVSKQKAITFFFLILEGMVLALSPSEFATSRHCRNRINTKTYAAQL